MTSDPTFPYHIRISTATDSNPPKRRSRPRLSFRQNQLPHNRQRRFQAVIPRSKTQYPKSARMGSHLHRKTPQTEIQAKKNRRLSTQTPFHTVRMASHIDQYSNTSDTRAGEASDSQSLRNLQIPCTYGNRAFGNIRLRESHLTVSTHQYQ